MKRAPSVWTLTTLTNYLRNCPMTDVDGKWVPARPEGMFSVPSRIALAWAVFTGRADVLRWPDQEGQNDEW